ncbi:kinase-like protein [Xylariaceae sp. AK1471]|nr:kinase-like protein [Xylariaceae sp. AK1471]
MESLREKIQALRCTPRGSELEPQKEFKFIPHEALYRLLSKDELLEAVTTDDKIPWYLREPTAEWIMKKGRRIFGILIVLHGKESYISDFMELDMVDGHLPFSQQVLKDSIPDIAAEFYAAQWEFAAPTFARNVIHRVLQPDHRLPFITNERFTSGGFGEIYKIAIHPHHQAAPLLEKSGQQMVRKEFKAPRKRRDSAHPDARDDKEEHGNELRALSILNELRHPNIIELLTSYTHKGRHNLIFPLVQEGSLENLLQEVRPPAFELDESFLVALCGLSSAIKEVHFYTLARLKIELIGCHHDLKPKNILVQGNSFVLADFGLSKLKEKTDRPSSLHEGGGGSYLAPECEDDDADFEAHSVTPSSDIWSFGCIIAEILTFMRRGSAGVTEFRSYRKVKIRYALMEAFHRGKKSPNEKALKWISDLESNADIFSKPLIRLVYAMLDLEPTKRPDAHTVTSRLRAITVQAYASRVNSLFKELNAELPSSFDAYSEWARFRSWASVITAQTDNDLESQKLDDRMDLMSTIQNLESLLEELESAISRHKTQLFPLFTAIRRLGEELYHLLPDDMQRRARVDWEADIIKSEEPGELEQIQKEFEDNLTNGRISTLARIKRMSIIAAKDEDSDAPGLRVDSELVRPVGSCGNHTLALLGSVAGESEKRVFIEWIRYNKHETDNFPKLYARIRALASLLHDFPGPADFRTLPCSAYVHQPAESAFGLIYDYARQDVQAPKTLAKILKETAKSRKRPTLESRFRLAHTLAVSLSGFHSVDWLHKSISPYNILFFVEEGSDRAWWLLEPYLTGFNHSRQDDALAFTLGPTTDQTERRYYHPDYVNMQGRQVRYVPEFDYYSLGLVLLEIGLWATLEDMTAGKLEARKPKEMLDYLLSSRIPILGHYMGTIYKEAVLACLNGPVSGVDGQKEDTKTSRIEFNELVVEPLRRCCAGQ